MPSGWNPGSGAKPKGVMELFQALSRGDRPGDGRDLQRPLLLGETPSWRQDSVVPVSSLVGHQNDCISSCVATRGNAGAHVCCHRLRSVYYTTYQSLLPASDSGQSALVER